MRSQHIIPFDILEANRMNKCMFFFVKMKLAHCKEAMKDLKSTKSLEFMTYKFNKLFKKDISEYKSTK